MKIYEDSDMQITTLAEAPAGVPLTSADSGQPNSIQECFMRTDQGDEDRIEIVFLKDGHVSHIKRPLRVRVWANSELTLKP